MSFVSLFSFLNAQSFKLNDKLPMDKNLHYGVLPNGITYYVKHNSEPKDRAYLQLVVDAGSVFEDKDQRGLAHMCEHMAFNGTKNFPKHALIEYLESLGMQFGADLNAQTSFDETVYMIEIPLDSIGFLDKGLQVIYDWATNVSYETDEINSERGVIMEEWRLGRGAQDRLQRQTFPVLLYKSKYAKRLPIGDTAIIKHCPPDNLRRFYKDWYRPDLEAVIAVGDFNADLVTKKIKQMFSKIPARKTERKHVYPQIPDHKKTLVKVATDKEAQYTILSIDIKHQYKPILTYGDYKKNIIKNLVSGMLNMRLQEIIQKPDSPIAYAGVGYSHFLGHKAIFSFFALPKANKALDAVKLAAQELQRAKKYGFTKTELDREKKILLSSIKKQYTNRNKISSNKIAYIFHNNFSVAKTPALSFEQKYELYKYFLPQINLNDVNNEIKQLVTDSNTVITLTGPKNVKMPTEKQILDTYEAVKKEKLAAHKEKVLNKTLLAKEPIAGKVIKTTTDNITGTTTWILTNGIKVVLKPTNFKDNQILLKAFSKGGYTLYPLKDNIDARNCADIVANSGVGNLNNIELTKFLSDKNVSVYPYVDAYSEGFSANSTKDDFKTMLQLVYAYFTEPRFDNDAFKTFIAQQKAVLENKSNNPQAIWQDSLMYTVYAHNKLFKPIELSDLNKINLNRVEQIYKQRFADPASFTFIFVGNLDLNKIKPVIEKYLGGLPAVDNHEKPNKIDFDLPHKTTNVYAIKGTAPKSLVYTIFPGETKRNLKNEIYLKAISYVMTDSLLDQIREKKQWTYSIMTNSNFRGMDDNHYLIGTFYSCAPDKVNIVNKYIYRIAHNFAKIKIPNAEMKKTIEKLKRDHQVKMRDNKYWLSQLTEMNYNNSKPDFITKYDQIVSSLNKKTIMKSAKKFIPDYYISVILKPQKKK